jgi:hypothetical protein
MQVAEKTGGKWRWRCTACQTVVEVERGEPPPAEHSKTMAAAFGPMAVPCTGEEFHLEES